VTVQIIVRSPSAVPPKRTGHDSSPERRAERMFSSVKRETDSDPKPLGKSGLIIVSDRKSVV